MRRAIALLALFALSACAKPAAVLGSGSDLVLRMDVAGGFTPPEYQERHVPEFSLFADGRVVVPGPQIEIYPSPALPSLNERTVTAEAVSRILERARAAGLEGPDRRYETMNVSDAPTTTFTVVTDGERHVTSAYALGFESQGSSDDEREALDKLQTFAEDLGNLTAWIDADQLGEERPFDPDAMRVYVHSYDRSPEPGLHQEPKDWPLDVPLASFGDETNVGSRCGAVDGEDFDAVYRLARASNELTPWRSGGERFLLAFRPLLPDETGCPVTS